MVLIKPFFSKKTLNILLFFLLFILLSLFINKYGLENLRNNVENLGIFIPISIFALRTSSIIVPALPSTPYSLLAGALLGFKKGVVIICLADLVSCSISFFISRKFGRRLVRRLVGQNFMNNVENVGKRHIENNIFLMIGLLMTGLFDFISYGIGLTKTPLKKFLLALIISIALSNPPVVALGAGVLDGGMKVLILAIICIFVISIISSKLIKVNDTN